MNSKLLEALIHGAMKLYNEAEKEIVLFGNVFLDSTDRKLEILDQSIELDATNKKIKHFKREVKKARLYGESIVKSKNDNRKK